MFLFGKNHFQPIDVFSLFHIELSYRYYTKYEEIVTDALNSCSAKLRKSFKTVFIQLMILYMVLPRKINFTQMGRYSDNSEQRFRQLFEREFDWMQFNLFLMRQRFGESVRKAIAIDASYISKSGKKTPYIGKFWSGCASAMKRGLEILGIGILVGTCFEQIAIPETECLPNFKKVYRLIPKSL